MARLLLAEKYTDTSFANLSLQQCAREILGFHLDKESQQTNWKGDKNNDITLEQPQYAAKDAHVSLCLYETLVPALAKMAEDKVVQIPSSWYTFNGRYGYPVKMAKTYWGKDCIWSVSDCTWFGGKFQGYM
ncbi:hypothetical protein MVEN_01883900 [Mycena venus]|uniref:3'-5' exonuclease domain-containing protein n=1 Tax=Mycena venus TaxID=2733690 RepID=A0A8H6XJ56_9AGAR|nr:hypothetical protein MVEN_01883900 [Mycena venus]